MPFLPAPQVAPRFCAAPSIGWTVALFFSPVIDQKTISVESATRLRLERRDAADESGGALHDGNQAIHVMDVRPGVPDMRGRDG